MADKYDTWPVNSNRAGKQAFRPILLVLDNKNINDNSKPALIEIFRWFDRKYHPLSLSDRDIENRLSKEQKAVLKQEVDRYKELARLKKEQTPKAKDMKMARKKGTAKPAKGKARLQQDETTPVDGEAADEDQDGDVRMADGENTAPLIDPTAEAVSSPVGGKRKRTATVTPSDSKRPRTERSKLSLIVTLKLPDTTGLELGSIQTTTQGCDVHDGQKQDAGDMWTADTRRTLRNRGSGQQRGVESPLELPDSVEGSKNDPDDADAQGMGDASGTSLPDNAPGQPSSRRQPQRLNKGKANVPLDDTPEDSEEESEEASEGESDEGESEDEESEDEESGPDVDQKLTRAELAKVEQLDPNWPKDKDGYPVVFGWDRKGYVDYLHEETEEEEREVPYNFLNFPERMRRDQRQSKRIIEQRKKEAKDRGEEYVPEKVVVEYDWTKHM